MLEIRCTSEQSAQRMRHGIQIDCQSQVDLLDRDIECFGQSRYRRGIDICRYRPELSMGTYESHIQVTYEKMLASEIRLMIPHFSRLLKHE
jgi:hypothetical protein